ncbi:MAG: phosphoribosylglycinamide formyltransferase [Firmicutes bacterium]|nr:phosphoribosylglycinamide formyltransferase [Bacillota bacterium]
MYKIAVFVSGGGSNLQAIIDACDSGKLNATVCLVVSNKNTAFALERAEKSRIPNFCLTAESEILATLEKFNPNIIFLAGYLKKIPPSILEKYDVYNIHPALLPKYGGKGMYGINVHKAVLAAGESETGVTIHKIDSDYDKGTIIAQKKVAVLPNDTAETLAARVLAHENIFIVEVISQILSEC